MASSPQSSSATTLDTEFKRGLGLYDSTMIVVGAMIGSGIFIVSADMARRLGSPGWLLVAWVVTGVLTITAALSYGELAAMMPRAGGQYVYLREAYSPLMGFLYGWTLFMVIQTGTIAAVAVAFAKYLGVLVPWVSETRYIVPLVHLSEGYALSFSTAQLVAVLLIVLLTWTNTRGLAYGRVIQNVFTSAKTVGLAFLIVVGLLLGWHVDAIAANFGSWSAFWSPRGLQAVAPGLDATTVFGLFVAICVVQTGSLFSSDAWHIVTFTAGEVKNPRRNLPLSLAIGTILVIGLYLLTNVAYLVMLPLEAIQTVPGDRVATAAFETVFPGLGVVLMAVIIMVSTFGCDNGLILAGARTYYAMARDRLFFKAVGRLNEARVPAAALVLQAAWASLLVLPRTYNPVTKQYGSLYSDLLDYVISAAVLFYILSISAIFRLRATRPDAERPYKALGYPVVPALYILGASTMLAVLFVYRTSTTWPGLIIIALGIPVYFLWARKQ
ncbi:MAG TPA: amino acid permease [Vicinamibacterales bacterium]|nr:amino acid permease [Vicinamibacterales bacterium]